MADAARPSVSRDQRALADIGLALLLPGGPRLLHPQPASAIEEEFGKVTGAVRLKEAFMPLRLRTYSAPPSSSLNAL